MEGLAFYLYLKKEGECGQHLWSTIKQSTIKWGLPICLASKKQHTDAVCFLVAELKFGISSAEIPGLMNYIYVPWLFCPWWCTDIRMLGCQGWWRNKTVLIYKAVLRLGHRSVSSAALLFTLQRPAVPPLSRAQTDASGCLLPVNLTLCLWEHKTSLLILNPHSQMRSKYKYKFIYGKETMLCFTNLSCGYALLFILFTEIYFDI